MIERSDSNSDFAVDTTLDTNTSPIAEILVAQATTGAATATDATAPQTPVAPERVSLVVEVENGSVLRLPEGTSIDAPRMNGANLEFVQPDGSVVVVPNGAIEGLTIVLGGVEIPPLTVAALFAASDIQTAAGPASGGVQSSGGNFEVLPAGDIGTAFAYGDLLDGTELPTSQANDEEAFDNNLAPRFSLSINEGRLSEEGLDGGNADADGDADTTNNAVYSGNLNASDPNGDPLSFRFEQPTTPVSSQGVELTWTGVGTPVLSGWAGETLVVQAAISGGSGAFTVTLFQPVDHALGGGENELRFDLPITATDGRGGSASTIIRITVEDDSPTVDVTAKTGEGAPQLVISLDESVGADRHNGEGEIGGNNNGDDAEGVLGQVKTSFEGGLAALFTVTGGYGADGAGSSSAVFSFAGIPADGLATNLSATHGGLITLYLEAGAIVGRDGANEAVFKIEIVGEPGSEQLQTTLLEAISHNGKGNLFDEKALLQLLGDGAVQLKLDVTRTDFDGDTTTDSATINLVAKDSTVISFEDDGPKVSDEFRVRMTVDEDDISTFGDGIPGGSLGTSPNDGNQDGSYTESPNNNARGTATVSGSLAGAVDFGSDGAATGGGFSISANAVSYFNGLGLSSKGDALSFSATDGKLTATAGGRLIFEFSVQANGNYDFRLYDQVDHDKPFFGADQNYDLRDTIAGDVTWLDFGGAVRATDGDGDWVDLGGKLEIRIRDDVPELVRGASVSGTVEEEALPWGNEDRSATPDIDDDTPNNMRATDYVVRGSGSNSLAALVETGADEDAKFAFKSGIHNDRILTSDGASVRSDGDLVTIDKVTSGQDSGGRFQVLTAEASDGRDVFTLKVYEGGNWEFKLLQQLDHTYGDNKEGFLTLNLSGLIKFTDADGDTINLDNAKFTVRVIDDMPEITLVATGQSVTIDETGGSNNDNNSRIASLFNSVAHPTDPSMAAVYAQDDLVNTTLRGGADDIIAQSLKLQIDNTNSGLFTTEGTAITLVQSGNFILGKAGGLTAFALHIDDSGRVSIAQYLSLKNPDTTNPDDRIDLAGKISAVYSVTDHDGDTVTKTLSIGVSIQFEDDGPTLTAPKADVNLLTNGDFADGTWTGAGWGGGLATESVGWKITGTEPGQGNVQLEYVQDGYFNMHAPSGGRMVDLGSSPGNTAISQSLTGLTVGQSYTLTFAMGSPDPASSKLEVYWNGQLIQNSSVLVTGTMRAVTIDGLLPDASGNGVLTFKEVGTVDYTGTYLADVGFAPTGAVDLPLLGGSIDENGTATITLGDHFSFGADGAGKVTVNPATVVITTPTGTILGQPTITVDPVTGQLHVNPGWGFDGLSQGEIATITIPYTVTDFDGDSKTGLYQLTINGQNDQVRTSEGFPDSGTITEYAADLPNAGSTAIRTEFDAPAGYAGYNGGGFHIYDDQGDSHSVTVIPGANAGYFGTLVADVSEETAGDGAGFVTWLYKVSDAALNPLQAGEQKIETFTLRVSDGHGTFADRLITVTLVGTNDKPVVSVDAGDLDHVVLNETNAGLEAHGTISVIDVDVKDVVTASVSGVTATGLGANFTDAQLKAFFSIGSGPVIDDTHTSGDIAWSFNSASEAFNFLAAGAEAVIKYTIAVSDGHGGNVSHDVEIKLVGTNDLPVVDLNGADAGNDANATSVEQMPQYILTAATLADVDSSHLSSMTVRFVGRPDGISEELSLNPAAQTAAAGLSVTYNAALGVLTITGAASVNAYQTILQGVSYINGSDNPAATGHSVEVIVNDGLASSVAHTVQIKVIPLNDAPVLSGSLQATVAEGGAITLTAAQLGYTDPDNSASEVVFRVSGLNGNEIRNNGALANSFTAAELAAGKITFVHNGSESSQTGFLVAVEDGNQDGSAPVAQPFAITVTPVNDAPGAPFDANGAVNEVAENAAAGTIVGLTAQSIDVDGDTVTYSLTNDAGGRFAIDQNTGVVTVKAGAVIDYETATQHTITVQASDGHGGVKSSDFAITVKDVQEGPVGIANSSAFYAFSNNAAPAGKPTTIALDMASLLVGTAAGTTYSFEKVRVGEDATSGNQLNGKWSWLSRNGNVISGNPSPTDAGAYIIKVIATAPNGTTAFTYVALTALADNATSTIFGNERDNEMILPGGQNGGAALLGRSGVDVLIGNAGNNVLHGDENQDALYGGAGGDYLNGGSQSDFVAGGAGDDTIYGEDGDDVILGEDGNDYIEAGSQNDIVLGGAGNDIIYGQDGNDIIYGDAGNDAIDAGSGNDIVVGGAGDDTIYAATGDDIVYGNDGNDRLYVGSGDDKVYGGAGDDLLTDDSGNDTYYFGLTDGQDTIDEGSGTDRIVVTATGAELTSLNGYDTVVGKNRGDLVVEFNGQSISVHNHFVGTNDRVELINFDGASYKGYNLGSSDYAVGRDSDSSNIRLPLSTSGNDFLVGEQNATNAFSGDGGNDLLFGGNRADNLSGGQGNDLLIGGGGNDILTGNQGDDILWGGLGNDTLSGGSGRDTFVFSEAGTANADTITDYVFGQDVIDLSDLLSGVADNQKASHVQINTVQNTISVDRGSGWELVATIEPNTVSNVEIKIGDDLAHINLNI